ncbi:hypothetical protein [Clostridium felsineum]|uniref:Uncharacterized protein n=1 Tax=Clostridium felsineum TaxID=36839 RepID=A0A1S8MDQ0_9CLOT|nr:hypothetical protein [Clostridium felsineum]URZ06431.1 hypothetical protein CLROS_017640 [Clostridium felsineum]URZ11466.1 hypothetical protein CROST_021830 [Clostridium felsineum]
MRDIKKYTNKMTKGEFIKKADKETWCPNAYGLKCFSDIDLDKCVLDFITCHECFEIALQNIKFKEEEKMNNATVKTIMTLGAMLGRDYDYEFIKHSNESKVSIYKKGKLIKTDCVDAVEITNEDEFKIWVWNWLYRTKYQSKEAAATISTNRMI